MVPLPVLDASTLKVTGRAVLDEALSETVRVGEYTYVEGIIGGKVTVCVAWLMVKLEIDRWPSGNKRRSPARHFGRHRSRIGSRQRLPWPYCRPG